MSAGLNAPVIYGGIDKKEYILEANGCGCAFIDYDNDGWMDIFLLTGTRLDGAPPGTSNRLYKNNRDGTFSDVTDIAGLRHLGWGNGVCIADYNNDGYDDIFCTFYEECKLYRNNGNGTFTDVTEISGLSMLNQKYSWSTGCSFLDYDRDGNLDIGDIEEEDQPVEIAAGGGAQAILFGISGLRPAVDRTLGIVPAYHANWRKRGWLAINSEGTPMT